MIATVDYEEVLDVSLTLSVMQRMSCTNISTRADLVIEEDEVFHISVSSTDMAVSIPVSIATVEINDETKGSSLNFEI